MKMYFASDYAFGINPETEPLIVSIGTSVAGAAVLTVPTGVVSFKDSYGASTLSPLATNAPLLVGVGAVAETQTPVAVNVVPGFPSTIGFTTTTYAHGGGTQIASGTVGLQEAINDCSKRNGGAVIVDGRWAQLGGTTAMITSAANGNGTSQVFILDMRGSSLNQYSWSGAAFVAAGAISWAAGANGQSFAPFVNSELLTLSTVALTTDTVGNLLPANSIIMAVQGTVNTTITTSTNWQLGDASTAGRFSAVDTTLTAGESVPKASWPPVQIGTGVASATTGVYQAAAAKVRVTVTGANAGAGKVRITVYGFTLVNATT